MGLGHALIISIYIYIYDKKQKWTKTMLVKHWNKGNVANPKKMTFMEIHLKENEVHPANLTVRP